MSSTKRNVSYGRHQFLLQEDFIVNSVDRTRL